MKLKVGLFTMALGVSFAFIIAVTALPAAAQEDETEEETPAASRWIFLGQLGSGSPSGGGDFEFDDVPRGYDDKTSYDSRMGRADVGGVEALWFPTAGRGFMLSGSLVTVRGSNFIEVEDEDDYGHSILDKKLLYYRASHLMIGAGYRFLYGQGKRYGTNLQFKIGAGGGDLAIDGVAGSPAFSGVAGLGANIYRRFGTGALLGAQLDFLGWGMSANSVEMKYLNTDADINFNAGGMFLSFIAGWEL